MSGHERLRLFLGKSVLIGLVLGSTVVALFLGELLARLVVNPGDFLLASLAEDPALGQRIAPHTTGHDALGFRNAATPERVNIVAIGDSQTYGVSAARDGSWPHQIGVLLGEPVYNMALGGYGPLEYLHLAGQEARKLQPRLLLVGFYFGNDLAEACRAAHQRPYWRSWREPGSMVVCDPEDPGSAPPEPKKRFAAARDWLSRHSVLYSLMRVTLLAQLASSEKDRIALQLPPDRQMIWRDPANAAVRTIFSPQLRLSAIDPRLPQVQEGLRITKRAFAGLKSEADAQGAKLLVVLIPTKERAYCAYLDESGARLPGALVALCDAEARVKKELVEFLTIGKIAFVDTTQALEAQIRKHVQVYPTDSDGHPRAAGYGAIAQAAYDAVRNQQLQR